MTDERTEQATPRRRSKARQEGQVSKSQDLSMAATLTASFVTIYVFAPMVGEKLRAVAVTTFSNLNPHQVDNQNFIGFLSKYIWIMIDILLPIMICMMIAGIAINYYQVGPLFSTKSVTPNLSKLSPETIIKGFKKFFQLKSFIELGKSLIKGGIVAGVGYSVYHKREHELIGLLGADIMMSLSVIGSILFEMMMQICIILFILGIADRKYQNYEYEKSIKMTKQEVKDERKNAEGDPKIKSKIRGIQMQFAMQRMMGSVPTADVVVTNPTHYAIALRYDTSKAPAPQVIAKGVDYVAFKIREIAEHNKIPIIQDPPLARTLYKIVPLDGLIPAELYVAVAEVLAMVYKSGKKRKF
jgi:flagellar biosynthetic protein FlhB